MVVLPCPRKILTEGHTRNRREDPGVVKGFTGLSEVEELCLVPRFNMAQDDAMSLPVGCCSVRA